MFGNKKRQIASDLIRAYESMKNAASPAEQFQKAQEALEYANSVDKWPKQLGPRNIYTAMLKGRMGHIMIEDPKCDDPEEILTATHLVSEALKDLENRAEPQTADFLRVLSKGFLKYNLHPQTPTTNEAKENALLVSNNAQKMALQFNEPNLDYAIGMNHSDILASNPNANYEAATSELLKLQDIVQASADTEKLSWFFSKLGERLIDIAEIAQTADERSDAVEKSLFHLWHGLELWPADKNPYQYASFQLLIGIAMSLRLEGKPTENNAAAIEALELAEETFDQIGEQSGVEEVLFRKAAFLGSSNSKVQQRQAYEIYKSLLAKYFSDYHKEQLVDHDKFLGLVKNYSYSLDVLERSERIEKTQELLNFLRPMAQSFEYSEINHTRWLELHIILGSLLYSSHRFDPSEVVEEAIHTLEKAQARCSKEKDTEQWQTITTNLASAYADRLAGIKEDNTAKSIELQNSVLDTLDFQIDLEH